MVNKEKYYQHLFEEYLANRCSREEVRELFDYLRDDKSGRLLLQNLKAEFGSTETPGVLPDEVSNRIRARLESEIQSQHPLRKNAFKRWTWVAAAACILTALTTGLYFYLDSPNTPTRVGVNKQQIRPGDNKAMLTLSDGSVIELDDAQTGVLAKQGRVAIQKSADGQLVYDLQQIQSPAGKEAVAFNTISTPRGGQYQVILPDGTRVWLNSASSLRFPTAFSGSERKVELAGEGYFEVSKNEGKPFIVASHGHSVEVLGTHFNVNAYTDEADVSTTLLEGAVKVKNADEERVIRPGEQTVVRRGVGSIKVQPANLKSAVAWKDGYFVFVNEPIESIMRKISRWYDVDVEYQGDVGRKVFGGKISRFRNVSEVFSMLELTGSVHFKIEGRRIIVMP